MKGSAQDDDSMLNKMYPILPDTSSCDFFYLFAILKTLYNTLFLPHLNYGILLWGSETESIHKVRKRALRIISDNKFNAHTEPICRAERLLKVKDIYRLGIYKFYYKLRNNHLPHYFQDFTPTFSVGVNHYSLRNPIRQIPRIKHEFPRHSLRYKLRRVSRNLQEGGAQNLKAFFFFFFFFFLLFTFSGGGPSSETS